MWKYQGNAATMPFFTFMVDEIPVCTLTTHESELKKDELFWKYHFIYENIHPMYYKFIDKPFPKLKDDNGEDEKNADKLRDYYFEQAESVQKYLEKIMYEAITEILKYRLPEISRMEKVQSDLRAALVSRNVGNMADDMCGGNFT